MIKLLFTLILVLGARVCMAQDFTAEAIEKMKAFQFMEGNWEGTGWIVDQDGKKESLVKESVAYETGGTIMVFRGKGYKPEGGENTLVHDALGVMYFDVMEKKYRLHSFINRGMNTIAEVELLDPGKFVWSFRAGPVNTIRYTLTYENEIWTEVGEMVDASGAARVFFGMELRKAK